MNAVHESFEGLCIYENEDGYILEDKGGFFINLLAHQEETEIRVWIVFRMFEEIVFWLRIEIGQGSECIAELADSRRTFND